MILREGCGIIALMLHPPVRTQGRRAAFVAALFSLAIGPGACGRGVGAGADASIDPARKAGASPGAGDAPAIVESPTGPAPTWHEHVAPLVHARCAGCHRTGGVAPFPLDTYEAARPFATAMARATGRGAMPPWGAQETAECQPRFGWRHDLRLSDAEKALVRRWAEAEAPLGDPARAAALPTGGVSLTLDRPNVRTTVARPYVVDGKRDQFRCFPLPFTFDRDVWLTGLQVVPGNPKVVHHVLVWLDEKNEGEKLAGAAGHYECFGAPNFATTPSMLAAWAPGAVPMEPPAGVGLQVKKGSRIVINVHYHPTGTPEEDATSLDLRWTTERPEYMGLVALVGNFRNQDRNGDGLQPGPHDPPSGPAFLIPPNVRDHVERQKFTVPSDLQFLAGARLWGVGTHMHYVGTDMKIDIDRRGRVGGPPAGEPAQECLLQTPNWDFHWQRAYVYDAALEALPSVRAGDVVHMRCLYDNSTENPHVRAALAELGLGAPRQVKLGEETLDEMCLGAFGLAFKLPR